MNTTLDIDVLRLAADHLDQYGHTHGWGEYGPGTTAPTCAHGALLSVCGDHPGDQHLWRPIISARGLTEQANDEHTKVWSTNRLRKYDEPTEAEMTAAFGPQWQPIRDLVRRAAILTDDEIGRLVAARGAAWDAAQGLVVRDLIGQHGFGQQHYDQLTKPWATVIGPAHPNDKAAA